MSSKDARANFSELIGSVRYTNEPVVIEKNGKTVAVVISPQLFELLQQETDRRFQEAVEQLHELNADKDPAQIEADIAVAVQEVRAARRKAAVESLP